MKGFLLLFLRLYRCEFVELVIKPETSWPWLLKLKVTAPVVFLCCCLSTVQIPEGETAQQTVGPGCKFKSLCMKPREPPGACWSMLMVLVTLRWWRSPSGRGQHDDDKTIITVRLQWKMCAAAAVVDTRPQVFTESIKPRPKVADATASKEWFSNTLKRRDATGDTDLTYY